VPRGQILWRELGSKQPGLAHNAVAFLLGHRSNRPNTTLKTAWTNVRKSAGVKGRMHDYRHTLIAELPEAGSGDRTVMDIAGHISKQILKHYSQIRMEAKRKALEAVWRGQTAAMNKATKEQKRNRTAHR